MKRSLAIIIVLNLLALALVGSLSFLVWRDARATVRAYASIYLAARSQAAVSVWQKDLNESAALRARVAEVFVNHDTLISFIERLEILAREEGVVLTLSEPEVGEGGLTLRLSLTANFEGMQSFLARIESLPYALRINNMSFRAENESFLNGQAELLLISFDDVNEETE